MLTESNKLKRNVLRRQIKPDIPNGQISTQHPVLDFKVNPFSLWLSSCELRVGSWKLVMAKAIHGIDRLEVAHSLANPECFD